jgi:hypothetical protein
VTKRCALIYEATGEVVNFIIMDPDTDPVPEGHIVVVDPPGHVQLGRATRWNGTDFDRLPDASTAPVIDGLDTI